MDRRQDSTTALSAASAWNPFWLPARFAIWAVTGYQRWISPYKGFCCAHRVLHRGDSCSQFVKRHLGSHGIRGLLGAARRRFRECRQAYRELRRQAAVSGKQAVGQAGTDKPGIDKPGIDKPTTPAPDEIPVADLLEPGASADEVAKQFGGRPKRPTASDSDASKKKSGPCKGCQGCDVGIMPIDCCCSGGEALGCEAAGGLLEGLSCISACG